MASLEVYSTDAHIGAEDREIFQHTAMAQRVNHRKARADVERELLKRGFTGGLENIADNRGWAQGYVLLTAEDDAGVTVPEGFEIYTAEDFSKVTFVTDAETVLAAGESALVEVTAVDFGEPGNVPEDTILYFEALAGLASATNPSIAVGGVDHQLTQACVYRCLELLYRDLSRNKDDAFWDKMMLYKQAYAEELGLLMAAGVELDGGDGDSGEPGVGADGRFRGVVRLERS